MARETAADNKQAVALLGLKQTDRVLDIGTGHGRALSLIAELAPRGLAVGVDASEVALRIAKKRNRARICTGNVRVEYAQSDALPFPDGHFDRAMAIHTLYFWEPAEQHLREIARVLRPHGKFVLAFRPAEDTVITRKFPAGVYTFRTGAEVESLLAATGFKVCRFIRRDAPGSSMVWIAARRA
jgi:ubiquinone/menaquinone biosynthesis C-methylase UbiE